MKRGEIWWASLPEPVGSEPGYTRPVLVVSSDIFNASKIATVVCVALTTNLRLAEAPGNVMLPARDAGLRDASVINVSQLITVTKDHLTERAGTVGKALMQDVEEGMKLVLGL